ncbi:MAG: hypothetical protein V4608_16300 [Bacteroidota bacterium]
MKPEIKKIFEVLKGKTEESQKETLLACATYIGNEQWIENVKELMSKIDRPAQGAKSGD